MQGIQKVQEIFMVRGQLQMPKLALTTTASETAAWNDNDLDLGVYYMWSNADCYFLHKIAAGGGSIPNADTGVILLANNPVTIEILKGDVISAQTIAGTGELHFIRINRGIS